MAAEWGTIPLRKLATRITKGTTPAKGKGFVPYGINYIKSESITPDGTIEVSKFAFIDEKTHAALARSQLQAGNVLFSMAGVYLGKTAVVAPEHLPANTNQAVGIITLDKSKADSRFVHYSIQSPACRSWVARSAAQSAQPNFNLQEIGDLPIPEISLEAQRAIAHILGTLDDKIELNRKQSEALETMARALFKAWFVDFEPVRAKLEGRWQRGQSLLGLPAHLYDLFPDRLVDSELGEIPEGWEVSALGEVCSYLNRGLSPKYTDSGGVLVLNQKCVRNFSIDFSKARRHDVAQRKIDGRVLELGDVLVNSTGVGTLGRVAQVCRLAETTIVDSHVTVVRSGPRIDPMYLGGFMGMKQAEIEAMGEGSTGQTELSRAKLGALRILLPTDLVLSHFSRHAKTISERISAKQEASELFSQLRDTLLPKLISGELRVPDAERILGVTV